MSTTASVAIGLEADLGRPGPTSEDLDVRRFHRTLDLDWRRASYSALTAAAHGVEMAGAGVGSEDDGADRDDEVAWGADLPVPEPEAAGPLADGVPAGRHRLRHGGARVFEAVDLDAPDLAAELQHGCDGAARPAGRSSPRPRC